MTTDVLSGLRASERALVRRASGLAWETFGPWVYGVACAPNWPLPGGQACPMRVFNGTADQVRPARQFVRAQLAGHPACDDAVAVASELASNAIVHSASRAAGGRFVVHATALRSGQAGVIVTDEGGPFTLPFPCSSTDAESGRGLTVVRRLSCLLQITEHDGLRSFIAVMPGINHAGSDRPHPGRVEA